jgi:hypothetical protein
MDLIIFNKKFRLSYEPGLRSETTLSTTFEINATSILLLLHFMLLLALLLLRLFSSLLQRITGRSER